MIIKKPTPGMYIGALKRKSRFNKTARAILWLLHNSWRFTNSSHMNMEIYDILDLYTQVEEKFVYVESIRDSLTEYKFFIFSIPKDIRQKLENAWEQNREKEPTLFDKIREQLEENKKDREQKRQEKIKEQEEFERKEKEIYDTINNLF